MNEWQFCRTSRAEQALKHQDWAQLDQGWRLTILNSITGGNNTEARWRRGDDLGLFWFCSLRTWADELFTSELTGLNCVKQQCDDTNRLNKSTECQKWKNGGADSSPQLQLFHCTVFGQRAYPNGSLGWDLNRQPSHWVASAFANWTTSNTCHDVKINMLIEKTDVIFLSASKSVNPFYCYYKFIKGLYELDFFNKKHF